MDPQHHHHSSLGTKIAHGITWSIVLGSILGFCFSKRIGFWMFLTVFFGFMSALLVGWLINVFADSTVVSGSPAYFAVFFLLSALVAIPLSKVKV